MKKKYVIPISFILVAAVGIISFYLLTQPTVLPESVKLNCFER